MERRAVERRARRRLLNAGRSVLDYARREVELLPDDAWLDGYRKYVRQSINVSDLVREVVDGQAVR